MSNFLRVAKPVAVVAGIWALGWGFLGLGLGVVLAIMASAPLSLFLSIVMNVAVGMTVLGFSAGVVFSIALALLESGAASEELSTSRVALAGAIGGALLPTILAFPWLSSIPTMVGTVMSVGIFGTIGLASALGLKRLLRARSTTEVKGSLPAL